MATMHAAQVVFAVRTSISEDLAFLDTLLAAHPGEYRKGDIASQEDHPSAHTRLYADMAPGRPYVKIDDDIVFIQVGFLLWRNKHACGGTCLVPHPWLLFSCPGPTHPWYDPVLLAKDSLQMAAYSSAVPFPWLACGERHGCVLGNGMVLFWHACTGRRG
jgi:hypothetical protein